MNSAVRNSWYTLSRLFLSVFFFVLSFPPLTLANELAKESSIPPAVPEAISNHPVAMLERGQKTVWLSMTGLSSGKSWQDLRAGGYWWQQGHDRWQTLPPLPGGEGRLAAQLVAANGHFWFFGGYTVAEDGHEISTPDVYRIQPSKTGADIYQTMPAMPVPVDDAVALVYQDRYIYLISGWHDVGNVNLVQIFDTQTQKWTQGEPFPGAAVFGHAGAIQGQQLLVCGGAKVDYPMTGARQFNLSEQCWRGTIRDDDYRRLDWKPAPAMPQGARYRAAAAGLQQGDIPWIIFLGGTHNPYNYDGIGYDGKPSKALDSVLGYNLTKQSWACFNSLATASMDHRSAVALPQGQIALVGGMDTQQTVLPTIATWQLGSNQPCEQ